MKKSQWLTLISILLVLFIAVLSIVNVEPVKINFIFTTVQWPLILVIIGSALLGALTVISVTWVRMFKEKSAIKQNAKILKEQKIANASSRSEINKIKNAEKEKI